jgi:hypothetical protein
MAIVPGDNPTGFPEPLVIENRAIATMDGPSTS